MSTSLTAARLPSQQQMMLQRQMMEEQQRNYRQQLLGLVASTGSTTNRIDVEPTTIQFQDYSPAVSRVPAAEDEKAWLRRRVREVCWRP